VTIRITKKSGGILLTGALVERVGAEDIETYVVHVCNAQVAQLKRVHRLWAPVTVALVGVGFAYWQPDTHQDVHIRAANSKYSLPNSRCVPAVVSGSGICP
jgi:hypothetical protein